MKRVPVLSSNVVSIGHCPETSTMEVEFRGGGVYIYHDVDADKHRAMMSADSIGGHLNAHIKGAHKFSKA